ncbi:GntR family transcriptional regulator [Amnibacterium setariae]|uniref:GntR family transcriptional regulator n=2 Tax=Amnibacterium setariae TaxID=2306585 RepID=A0A3A1U218_9MICO|nr:GntR family transcriptional regulator [Amnibacterium setariae]
MLEAEHRSPSERVYALLRAEIMRGDVAPRSALRPQALADRCGVSLAVVRESLLRLVGEGLAERLPNRGFQVPAVDDERWQQLAAARKLLEPPMLRLAIEHGDLEWEAAVRAALHRLEGTPLTDSDGSPHFSDAWSEAHRRFHRALLAACGNPVLLEMSDRLWTATELARRWSVHRTPDRRFVDEHRALERAALQRDADAGQRLLAEHLGHTAAGLDRPAPAND